MYISKLNVQLLDSKSSSNFVEHHQKAVKKKAKQITSDSNVIANNTCMFSGDAAAAPKKAMMIKSAKRRNTIPIIAISLVSGGAPFIVSRNASTSGLPMSFPGLGRRGDGIAIVQLGRWLAIQVTSVHGDNNERQ